MTAQEQYSKFKQQMDALEDESIKLNGCVPVTRLVFAGGTYSDC